jgi:hypothetical protein
MARSNNLDPQLFDDLDNRINFNLVNNDVITPRHIYGALYSYYKSNRGKLENILNFENLLESEPTMLHSEMTLILLDLVHETKVVDPERLNILFRSFYKINLIDAWEREIHYKIRNIAELHRLFMKHEIHDIDLTKLLVESTIKQGRIHDIRKYHQLLLGLDWMNTNPKSQYFNNLDKEIDIFKNRIRKNENKSWKYDVDVIRFLYLLCFIQRNYFIILYFLI